MAGADGAVQQGPPAAPPTRRRRWLRALLAACALALVVPVLLEGGRVTLGNNFHAVVPGRVYRCAQHSGPALERLIADHGIRTVVNLRGCCNPAPWYLEQCRATHRRNVSQEDICFSAGRLPSATELRRFIDVLDHAEYPLVMHCRRGADRTGMAAAVVLLLQTDASLAEALGQLGLRYGHLPLGRTANLDEFFRLYAEWLSARGEEHSPATFRRWALHEYGAGPCRAAITRCGPGKLVVPRGKPHGLRVRARNEGVSPWRLSPVKHAGFHLGFFLWDEYGRLVAIGKAGLFEAEVAPGETIELTVALPALERPGRYRLMLDMADAQHCWFYQTGSEPLEEELEVRE
jgi:hypothetical protein